MQNFVLTSAETNRFETDRLKSIKEQKEVIKVKFFKWGCLTKDLLKKSDFNQSTLAKKCKVGQQSVSGWTTNRRRPGAYSRNILLLLADHYQLDIDHYELDETTKPDIESWPKEILEFCLTLDKQTPKKKREILEMGHLIMEE